MKGQKTNTKPREWTGADVTVAVTALPEDGCAEGDIGPMLQRALDSVGAQTVHPGRCVISIEPTDPEQRLGIVGNKNHVLQSVSSEWVAFLDYDDELLPEHVESLLECANEPLNRSVDLIYPWCVIPEWDYAFPPFAVLQDGVYVNPYGVPFGEQQREYLLTRGNFIQPTVLARTESVRAAGGWQAHPSAEFLMQNQAGLPFEDWGLWCAMLRRGARFVHLPKITYMHHRWGGNTSPWGPEARPWPGKFKPQGVK